MVVKIDARTGNEESNADGKKFDKKSISLKSSDEIADKV